jgi:anti-anti-sigma factor
VIRRGSVIVREDLERSRVIATGEIDLRTEDEFRDALGEAAEHHGGVLVDLTAVRFLGGAALGALEAHRDRVGAVLVRMNCPTGRTIDRALSACGLAHTVAYQPRHHRAHA